MNPARPPVPRPTHSSSSSSSASVSISSQLSALRLRYKDSIHTKIGNTENVSFHFVSSDPDFPFDLAFLSMRVKVTNDTGADLNANNSHAKIYWNIFPDNIPEAIAQKIEKAINEAASRYKSYTLTDMLKWLDNNLEQILVDKPKAPAIKFVVPKAGPPSAERIFEPSSYEEKITIPKLPAEEKEDTSVDELTKKLEETNVFRFPQPTKPLYGLSLSLANLCMSSISLLTPASLNLTIKCARCDKKNDCLDLKWHVDRYEKCPKCSRTALIKFYPDLAHASNSCIGMISISSASVVDILPFPMQFQCEGCVSSQKPSIYILQKIQKSDKITYFCNLCHSKMAFSFTGIDFTDVRPKTEKIVPKQLFKVGTPLPEKGTCKHYKKSFRWLRFPCCGKAYPCDTCHDQDNPDHKASWANRQICGNCSREQSFSANKPCDGCGASPTGNTTAFWEGGKGTRDVTVMNRKDTHKYKNMNKTVSKKAASISSNKS